VKELAGGEAWINSATLLGRKQLLDRISAAPMPVATARAERDGCASRGDEARLRRAIGRLATYGFDAALESIIGGFRAIGARIDRRCSRCRPSIAPRPISRKRTGSARRRSGISVAMSAVLDRRVK
jgi:hypothetical protein